MKVIKEKPRRRQYPFPNITESRCRWESGISRKEEKITPELPAEVLSRPGRISCVKGTHMMVCSNRWLNESKLSSFYGDGSFFFFMVMHRQVTDPCIENSGRWPWKVPVRHSSNLEMEEKQGCMTKSPQTLSLWKEKNKSKSSGKMNTFLRRVLRCVKAASHMYSMMDRQPQTVSHISAMLRPV